MNNLKFAISYMQLRVAFLELRLENARYRDENPREIEAKIAEANHLLGMLKGFVE